VQAWGPEPSLTQYSPMPSSTMNGFQNGFANGQSMQHTMHSHTQRSESSPTDGDGDELIPTAIVIKNIPFAVKKESLQLLMQDMGLPSPYAFNYHFDNGVFRGLAFANFQNPDDTKCVIEAMNHMELQGRKLRVEYKKMLPLQERERIEREKRERRGQLEEQHRPVTGLGLHNQPSMGSLTSGLPGTSPSPVSMRSMGLSIPSHPVMRGMSPKVPHIMLLTLD
jgi:RNA recognition motif-containing protein